MKKTATFRLVYFLLFILTTTSAFSTNYTWTGTTNTSWTTTTNWTPNGVPAESDSITIVSASNNPQLSGNRGVHRLVINGGTLDLNGDSLTVYGSSLFTSGQVDNGQLILHGTADFTGTQIGAGVYATCTTASLSGSRFISPVYLEVSSACTGNGGNTFDGTFTYKVTGSGVFTLAAMQGDTYNNKVEFHNNGVAYLYIATTGINIFNGDVFLYSSAGKMISFGSAGGSSELANGYTLNTAGAFNCMYLNITSFYQQGHTPQNISIAGYTTVNLMQTIWDGSLQLTAPSILLRGNTFKGVIEFEKTGSILNQCDGNNNYFQDASFKCSGSDGWRLATRVADVYYANTTFESTGGGKLEVAYKGDNSIRGDLTVNSPDVIFGSDNGTLVFDGTLPQAINGNATATIHKMVLNKSLEHVTLNTSIDIRGSVTFVQGNLISTTNNAITFLASSEAIGASNSSFVSGPVKKVGDSAFEFPVGKGFHYRSIGLSAGSDANDVFLGEYFNSQISNISLIDSTLSGLDYCEYWEVNQLNGSSAVNITLPWIENSCNPVFPSLRTIAMNNGSQWINIGLDSYQGTMYNGSAASLLYNHPNGQFTLANLIQPFTGINFSQSLKKFALLASDSIWTNNPLIVHGKIGAGNSISSNFQSSDSILPFNSGSTSFGLLALDSTISYFNGLQKDTLPEQWSNSTIQPGVYVVHGNLEVNGKLTFIGDTNSVYIIAVEGDVSINDSVEFLTNQILPRNVIFIMEGSLSIGAAALTQGVFISKENAIISDLSSNWLTIFSEQSILLYNSNTDNQTSHYLSLTNQIPIPVPAGGINQLCNLLNNGCFEQGTIPIGDSWIFPGNGVTSWSNIPNNNPQNPVLFQAPCTTTGGQNNTPDIFDSNANSPVNPQQDPRCNSSCGFQSGSDYPGVPQNFATCNTPVRIPGTFRYAGMFPNESISGQLNTVLQPTRYFLEFYIRAGECLGSFSPDFNNICIGFYNGNNPANFIPIGTVQPSSYPGGDELTNWIPVRFCIDFTTLTANQLAILPSMNRFYLTIGLLNSNNHPRVFLDDFHLSDFGNAGPDVTLTCGQCQNIGPTCNVVLDNGSNVSVSYLWNTGATTGQILVCAAGTYTLTTTITYYEAFLDQILQCTTTDQVVVTGGGTAMSLTMNPVNSCISTTGSISTNVSGGTAPYTYIWSNGATTSAISNITSGTFTVTVTDANGCTISQVATVIADLTSFSIQGITANCSQSQANYNFTIIPYNPANALNYVWSNSSNITFVSFNQSTGVATFSFPTEQGGTITVTYTNGLCSFISTVTVFNCCRNESLPYLSDANSSSLPSLLSGLGIATTVGNNVFLTAPNGIYINGTLTLNSNLFITNSDLRMGPGARIIVPANRMLYINYSDLHAGCSQMWQGIDATGANSLVIITSNNLPQISKIRDAQYGLFAHNLSNYVINNSTKFDLDYVGVRTTGSNYQFRRIADTHFECNGTLLPMYPGQTPQVCSVTYAGIQIDNVLGITIGDPTYSQGPVIFRDINIGLLSRNSICNVFNSKFSNINPLGTNTCFTGTNVNYRGSGIAQIGFDSHDDIVNPPYLFQRGFGDLTTSTESFENCLYGIYSSSSIIDVQRNKFDDVITGVHDLRALSGQQSLIMFNRINVKNIGVSILNPNLSTEIKVYNNHIDINGTFASASGSGVYVRRSGVNFNPLQIGIRDNVINVLNARYGVRVENISNVDVRNNPNITLATGGNSNKIGIYLSNLNNNAVSCNVVSQQSTGNRFGIYSTRNPNAQIGCNVLNNVNAGIMFVGNNNGMDLLDNTINSGNIGLQLSSTGGTVIGQQTNNGNQWNGTFTSWGALKPFLIPAPPNRFFVEPPISIPLWPPTYTANWFQQSACTNCTYNCNNIPVPPSPPITCNSNFNVSKYEINFVDSSAIENDTLSIEAFLETNWIVKRDLYEDLLFNPVLKTGNSLITSFFNNNIDTSFGRLANIRYSLNQCISQDSLLLNSINASLIERDSLVQDLRVIDSLSFTSLSIFDSTQVILDREDLLNEIGELNSSITIWIQTIYDSLYNCINNLKATNSALESTFDDMYEWNEFQMNKITMQMWLDDRDTVTTSEKEILESMIWQCPTNGGKAIYEARGLYQEAINDTIYFDDDSLCNGNQRVTSISNVAENSQNRTALYPNPTENSLNLEYKLPMTNSKYWFVLEDLSGRRVVTMELRGEIGQQQIDITFLKGGVYIGRIITDSETFFRSRVVVLR